MRHVIYAAGLLVGAAASVQAQGACSQMPHAPAVGSWAEYKTDRNGQETTSRFAVVGQEKRDGKDGIWFETAMDSPRGRMITEVLVPGFPFEPGAVMEMVMKRGDQPAVKISGDMMAMMRPNGGAPGAPGAGGPGRGGPGGGMRGGAMSSLAEQCKTMTTVGQETITVPAGTFKTTHFRNPTDSSDVWVSRDVPFGMVKTTGRSTMVLSATGKDAKKQITETPQAPPGM